MHSTELLRGLPDFRRLTINLLVSFLMLSAVSCKAAALPEGQKKFGSDADYFIGFCRKVTRTLPAKNSSTA